MRYVGIDLGTTNSAICSFDGAETHIWQSPEQTNVTPSAIYVDRRGHRYYGRRAYEMAPLDEKNAATLFKRYMGTSKKFTFERTGETLTPVQCSAEILRVLYGYLPENGQENNETVTVVTVPAAFGQVKKDATREALELAGIGKAALMQEPVAAVMSAMKEERIEGAFLIYDLGGGTFDASVAEYSAGKVRLLAQGGKEMCGGRDWDRMIMRTCVIPWLLQHFQLPEDLDSRPAYRRLRQLALYACEQAKIALSSMEEAYIQMDEDMIQTKDLEGEEIYLDIPLRRAQLDGIIADQIQITVEVSKEVIQKAGVVPQDVRKIVFIGGPTVYAPLQKRVMEALKIREKGTADPMTAVAEGAAIYAESIDWSTESHRRQENISRAEERDFEIRYEQRSSEAEARVAVIHRHGGAFSAEIISERDGLSSGKASFQGRGIMTVQLKDRGINRFRLNLYDENDQPVEMDHHEIVIRYVLPAVASIPSSHAIAIKALDQVGGKPVPVYLVQENEALPKRGVVRLRAGARVVAGSSGSIVFTLWEGEIKDPVDDNRYIGTYRISGDSFSDGIIQTGAEIDCEYEMDESGHLVLGVAIPSVGAVFAQQNYYSRLEGEINLEDTPKWAREAEHLENRLTDISAHFGFNGEIIQLLRDVNQVKRELNSEDLESVQQAVNDLQDCQKKLALFTQKHLKDMRIMELNRHQMTTEVYQGELSAEDRETLNGIYVLTREAIDFAPENYSKYLLQYRRKIWELLIKSDRYITDQFKGRINRPEDYTDRRIFDRLKAEGMAYLENGEVRKLLSVIARLGLIEKREASDTTENMFEDVSVLKA